MRTGIVLEILDDQAVVMGRGGGFVTVKREADWQVGDVVSVYEVADSAKKRKHLGHMRRLVSAAACILFLAAGASGVGLYFNETALVSIDVNPSIELGLNRFDRVISAEAKNPEGEAVLRAVSLKNKRYCDALELLVQNDSMSGYIAKNSLITVAVQAEKPSDGQTLVEVMEQVTAEEVIPHHQNAQVEYYQVDRSLVEDAHAHNVTAGKYLALLDLQEADASVDIDAYIHHSIGEIRDQAENCRNGHGSGQVQEEVNGKQHRKQHGGHSGRGSHE